MCKEQYGNQRMQLKKKKPQQLNKILDTVLSKHGYINNYYESELIKKWPSLVGKKIAEFAECTNVRDNIVYVRVASSSWRQEISFLKEKILLKIKKETKFSSIKDINFY